jgi:hypothetical protein
MHYYNALPSHYRHRLEEKYIDNLGSTLHTCLEYEEHLERTGLPKGDSVKQMDMYAFLQLVQDMNNRMVAYERKGNFLHLLLGHHLLPHHLLVIPMKTNFIPNPS